MKIIVKLSDGAALEFGPFENRDIAEQVVLELARRMDVRSAIIEAK